MDHDEASGAYAGLPHQDTDQGEQEVQAPAPIGSDVWAYEPHTSHARAHRVTCRRDDSLSFHAANRESGLSAARTLNDYERRPGILTQAEYVEIRDNARIGYVPAGEEPEDVEAQGAIYLHDWIE